MAFKSRRLEHPGHLMWLEYLWSTYMHNLKHVIQPHNSIMVVMLPARCNTLLTGYLTYYQLVSWLHQLGKRRLQAAA